MMIYKTDENGKFTNETLDCLFEAGKMPAWAYYAQRGLDPDEALRQQRQKILNNAYEQKRKAEEAKQEQARTKKQAEQAVEKAIDENLEPAPNEALAGLLDGLGDLNVSIRL